MKLIKILLISVLFIPLSFQSFAAPTGQVWEINGALM